LRSTAQFIGAIELWAIDTEHAHAELSAWSGGDRNTPVRRQEQWSADEMIPRVFSAREGFQDRVRLCAHHIDG
jgi:hypothetical protein